jgi:hypothetical protein
MSVTPNSLVPAIIASFFAWRIYARVRRNIGRQPLQPKRVIVRVILLAVVTCGLAVFCTMMSPRLLIGLSGGVVLGALLALAGLSLTQFETTAEGRFYTPNPYIGGGLSVLFVGRLVYRLFVLSANSNNPGAAPGLLQSPLSLCVFGLLAGYYIAYFIGLLARTPAVPA